MKIFDTIIDSRDMTIVYKTVAAFLLLVLAFALPLEPKFQLSVIVGVIALLSADKNRIN